MSEIVPTVNIKRGDTFFRINESDLTKKDGKTYTDEEAWGIVPESGTAAIEPGAPVINLPVEFDGELSVSEIAGRFYIVGKDGKAGTHSTFAADGYENALAAIDAIRAAGFTFIPAQVSA